ncbi:MAG: AI-2E family transporter, partial [Anaerolineales bacterium]
YPLVRGVERYLHLSYAAAVNLVYFLTLLLILGLPSVLLPSFFEELRKVANDLVTLFLRLRSEAMRVVVIAGIPIYPAHFLPDLSQIMNRALENFSSHALELVQSTSRSLAWLLVTVVAVYYLLHDSARLRRWIIQQVHPAYQDDVERLYREIKKVWAAYLGGQIKLMLIVGIVFTLVWLVIGLPGAVILGFLTGLFSLIPEIGPLAATLLAVGVALIEGSTYLPIPNFWFAALVVLIYVVLINFKNIWLRPRVLGDSLNMHHGVVFIAVLTAAVLDGVLGALIVLPLLASAEVLWRYLRNRIYGEPPFSGFPPDEMSERPLNENPSPDTFSSSHPISPPQGQEEE